MTTDELAKMSDEELWDAIERHARKAEYWRCDPQEDPRRAKEHDDMLVLLRADYLHRIARQVPPSGVHVYRDGVEVKDGVNAMRMIIAALAKMREIVLYHKWERGNHEAAIGWRASVQLADEAINSARILIFSPEAATLAKQTAARAGKEEENG